MENITTHTPISILYNDKEQALLLLEGEWPSPFPKELSVIQSGDELLIMNSDSVIGSNFKSNMLNLMVCREFYIGILKDSEIDTKLVKIMFINL